MTRTYVQRWWLLRGGQPGETPPERAFSARIEPFALFIPFLAENAPFVAGEQKPPYGARRPGVPVLVPWW